MSDNVGGIMAAGNSSATKTLIKLAGKLVYIAGVIYAEVHGYSLLMKGVDPDMLIWATVGIIALGITALVLPEGLHYAFHAPLQRTAAFGFYGLDLAILFFNAVLDYNLRTGGQVTGWMATYLEYIVPSTPVIAALGWTIIFLLDPAARERIMVETLKASTREALAARITEQAKAADVSAAVDMAAEQMARDIIAQTLGASAAAATRRKTPAVIEGTARDAQPDDQPKRKRPIYLAPARRTAGRATYQATAAADPADPTRPQRGG